MPAVRAPSSLHPYGGQPAGESGAAALLLERAGGTEPDAGLVALVEPRARLRSERWRAEVRRIARELHGDPAIARVRTVDDRRANPALLSRDGSETLILAYFEPGSAKEQQEAAERLEDRFEGDEAVRLGGTAVANAQLEEVSTEDLLRSELIAFPLLLALCFWFFRGLVAALLPLLLGGLASALTLAVLTLTSNPLSLSVFALNFVTGLGLGLSIDYSLFIVSRYREELARCGPCAEALRRTMATAGRTVLYSAITVAVALAALMVFPQRIPFSVGFGGCIVTLVSAASALLVLPAVLALLGDRVDALAPRRLQRAAREGAERAETGAWYRLSRFVMRRAAPVALGSSVLLIVLGIPFFGIELGAVDSSVLPRSSSARQVDDALQARFELGGTAPVQLALASSGPSALDRYVAELRAVDGVAAVGVPVPVSRDLTLIELAPRADSFSMQAQDLVRELRERPAPGSLAVGGQTADFIDQKQDLTSRLPLALAIVVVATLTILFLMTGSVVLPVKALIMNLLTLSAAFGILAFVFQAGRLEGLLAYESPGAALEYTAPVLLFAVAFGLSTDYAVFLLARIKEARDGGAGDDEAVAIGLERTGRIVTSAALLFCVALGAFAAARNVFVKELATGIALAVAIDATIVRALLVPSLMKLLGRSNWWAPAPLRRLHARSGLSDAAASSASGRRTSSGPGRTDSS